VNKGRRGSTARAGDDLVESSALIRNIRVPDYYWLMLRVVKIAPSRFFACGAATLFMLFRACQTSVSAIANLPGSTSRSTCP
jgi:hypothetical protein